MKKTIFYLVIFLLFVSIGSNVLIYIKLKTENHTTQLKPVKSPKQFSFIATFSKEDKHKYSNFLKEGDSNELKGFTPTQTLLIYFDMVQKDNINGIYNLTYKDDRLPTKDNFNYAYTSSDGPYNNSKIDLLIYRYYNKTEETFENDNKASATIGISTGTFTTSTIYSFKKNADVWQIELSHLFKVNGISFDAIYTDKDITKIVYGKNGNFKELTDPENINNWVNNVRKIKFIRDENQEDREVLLLFDDGCSVKAYHNNKEIGDFKHLKLKDEYYKSNTEFDEQVKTLCK
ncbi:hypothetical protein [Gottfriedia solisilvae]|uniref:hypothetical protein n=1 Tax=Gottfriedia solisilvae TaxID=1516104 RepID=UPI003D2EBE9A